jgi:hypothetical protein
MAEGLQTIRREHDEIAALLHETADPGADRRASLNELIRRMAAHISAEQSLLVPALRRAGLGGKQLRRQLRREYRHLGHLLVLIERRKVNSPDLPDLVTDLRDTFARHARGLGSDLLASLEQRLPPEELAGIGSKLEHGEETILSHPHPHLLSLGPVSRLTTKLAAHFDRARDRTVSNQP